MSDIADVKKALRAAMIRRRATLPVEARTTAAETLVAVWRRERPVPCRLPTGEPLVVSGFWPMGEEIDIRPLLRALHADGHGLALPVTPPRGQPLTFRRWLPGAELVAGPVGTSQPSPHAAEAEPDALIVPLLAFDSSGFRLGYGGGYYDRTLRGLRRRKPVVAVGVAFEAQRVEHVPTDPHDERLDWLVTEKGPTGFA